MDVNNIVAAKTNIFASFCIQNLVPLHDDYYGLKGH